MQDLQEVQEKCPFSCKICKKMDISLVLLASLTWVLYVFDKESEAGVHVTKCNDIDAQSHQPDLQQFPAGCLFGQTSCNHLKPI